jgi:hypothetical protein
MRPECPSKCNDTSFRLEDSNSGEARTTCRIDPFSHRAIPLCRCLSCDRPDNEPLPLRRCSLLQHFRSSDFDIPRPGHWGARVAFPTRKSADTRSPPASSRARLCLECDDLADLVDAFPCAASASRVAKAVLGDRTLGGCCNRIDRTLGWIS